MYYVIMNGVLMSVENAHVREDGEKTANMYKRDVVLK